MESINDAVADVLRTVRMPGDFYAAGRCAMHLPLIEVDGVGPIALPLLPAQAAQHRPLGACLGRLLRRWGEEPAAPGDQPLKLVYPLEHAYTPAELSFAALKGADAAAEGVEAAGRPASARGGTGAPAGPGVAGPGAAGPGELPLRAWPEPEPIPAQHQPGGLAFQGT